MGTFRRHLSVLLWKNSVLKRRHPCSLLSELFLAIGSIGLLTLARHLTSNLEVTDFEAEHHVMQSMLVRLPECAEFLPDCSVELVKDEPHGASCVEGITYGCKGSVHHTGLPGVWVVMGCHGVFRVKGHANAGEHFVQCKAKADGGARTCAISACDIKAEHREPCDTDFRLPPSTCLQQGCCFDPRKRQCYRSKAGRRLQNPEEPDFDGPKGSIFSGSALMDMLMTKGGVRRLDATFAVAPKGRGAEEFQSWLIASRHPWAKSVRIFDTAEEIQQHLSEDHYPRRNGNSSELLCGAVIFETEPWSQEVKYTLRFNQSLGYDPNLPSIAAVLRSTKLTTQGLVEPKKDGQPNTFDKSGLTWYSQSGFLALQRSVDGFIERISRKGQAVSGPVSSQWLGEDGRPHVVVPFPTPGWSLDVFAMLMPQLLSMFLLISLAYSVNRMITGVVMEREARLREGMRMMGMRSSAFYASWVVTYVLLYLFVVTGVVFLLSVGQILPRSSPSLLFVWLMIFSLAAIAYGLVITTFFTRAKTAATVGSILFYTTSYFKHLANPASSPSSLRLLSLLPPVAFEMGADLVAGLESQQVGVTWSNVNIHYHNYSLLESAMMLLLDTLILFVLFLYLDQVMPKEVGIQRPWYFPVSPAFWADLLGKAPPEAPHVDVESPMANAEVTALVERDVGEAAAMMSRNGQTVEIVKLSKHFGQLRAVENLDLVMYQGEIFALLGHNGAGKTTTLAMLCGLIPPSSGRCLVFGSDRPDEVQGCLGVCPQHDVLWETMTCEEHLTLFAGFKGVPSEAVAREVSYMLDRVGLEKAGACKVQAGRLSGGMKRKLSLGIAFLGGSRLVVLDEPTSGLDPFSRRSVWELLRSMKQGRVTVLSTHYMDEADILGDRIAILHEGRLKCCGSPQFLKRAYDCGYNVTFVKRPGCDIDVVKEAVCRHVPELTSEVSVLSNSGKELILQFPFSAARHFPKVLGSLEQQLEELRVESYGISVTTLEEVFLKVASGDAVPRSRRSPSSPQANTEYIELTEMRPAEEARVEDRPQSPPAREVFAEVGPKYQGRGAGCLQQTKALVRKRIKYGLRDRRGVICQLLMPTATLLLFLVLLTRKLFSSQPVLELSVADYNPHCHSSTFQRADFSNRVEWSHLPALDKEKAAAVLKPGQELWHGELRHHPPAPASEEEISLQKAVFVSTPKLLQSGLRLGRDLEDKKGRRLSQESLVNISGVLSFLSDQYSSFRRAQQSLEAIAHNFPAQGDRWMSSWTNLVLQQTSQKLLEGDGRRLFAYGNRGFDRLCPTATKPERMLWHFLDRDHDNEISKKDFKLAVQDAQKRHNSSVVKMLTQGLAREEIRQQLGFDIQEIGSEQQMEEWLDWIAEEVAMSFMDLDGDGVISIEDFCSLGSRLKGQAEHFVDLAQAFSEDILDSSSICPRYGAFYVVAEPRTDDTYGFAAPADAVVFANSTSKHSAAVYQAALTNARLARLKKDKTVAVKVHLFPQTKDEQIILERFAVFMLSVYITFCLSFIPAGITHYLVKERSSGARQLQALSGASHFAYWLSNMIYDVALYIVPAISVPLALHVFGYHAFLKGDCGNALFAVLAAFGPAIAGFSYIVSFLFKDHSRASNTILTFCLVGAIVLSTVLFVLAVINYDPAAQYPSACDYPTEDHPEGTCRSPGARLAERILGPLFRMVPTVCVYQALLAIALVANLQAVIPEGAMDAMQAVGGNAPHVSLKPFAFEWAGEPLLYLVVEGFAFFFVAVLLDAAIHSPRLARQFDAATWRHRLTQLAQRRTNDEARLSPLIESSSILEGDDSVWAERERAAMATKEELALHVWDLEKTYRRWLGCRSPKRAVRGVSFAIHSGEVFGLLGHNGAGKTSAIKCFVGEQCCSTGAVHLGGFDMERQTNKARQRLGYCPQFDALLELLTVEDHLEFYAAIRGLPKQAVEDSLQDFKLVKLARRRAEVLSGGNKRKLSAALALMGSPSLAILDEPSCGLDPAARRALWTAVHEAVGISRSPMVGYSSAVGASAVLLTTHSMEEAEALSNRLGIMANGQLLTVGTAQQIKAKHGSCHELMLRLRPETEEALSNMMRQWQAQLDSAAVGKILEADAWKRAAYARPRCIVRLQLEQSGVVESSVFAEWFLQQANGEKVEKFLSRLLGDRVELAEDFGIYWRFRLPRSGLSIPQLFQQLEDNAENFGVAEYTLSQATLEQIFNTITEGADTYGGQSG